MHGQPPRLPRLGVLVAEAASGARRHGRSYYETTHANVHRGVYAHRRGGHPTLYEDGPARRWPGSSAPRPPTEIVFTKNVTEAINLVAYSWGRANLAAPATSCVLTEMEHHANLVPWLHPEGRARASSCATCRSPTTATLDLARPRPAARRGQAARRHRHVQRARHDQPGAPSSPTPPTPPAPWSWSTAPSTSPTCRPTSAPLGCDFFGFTGHKMLGPTGIGVPVGAARSCSRPCRRSSVAAR